VVHDLPSRIPYPDSVTRITVATQAHNDARHENQAAMKRLNDYTLRGIIPIDLRDADNGASGWSLLGAGLWFLRSVSWQRPWRELRLVRSFAVKA